MPQGVLEMLRMQSLITGDHCHYVGHYLVFVTWLIFRVKWLQRIGLLPLRHINDVQNGPRVKVLAELQFSMCKARRPPPFIHDICTKSKTLTVYVLKLNLVAEL